MKICSKNGEFNEKIQLLQNPRYKIINTFDDLFDENNKIAKLLRLERYKRMQLLKNNDLEKC